MTFTAKFTFLAFHRPRKVSKCNAGHPFSHFVSAVINKILLNAPDKIFLWFGHLLDYYILKILV